MSAKCKNCNVFLRKLGGRRKTILTEKEARLYSISTMKEIVVSDVLCSKCRLIPYRGSTSRPVITPSSDTTELVVLSDEEISDSVSDSSFNISGDEDKDDCVELQIKRVISTHRYCIICKSENNIHQIPLDARMQVFSKLRIYIPHGDRCCDIHLIGKKFYEEELSNLRVHSNTSYLPKKEVSMFLNMFVNPDTTLFDKLNDFNMPEEQLRVISGFSWENIVELREMLTSMRNTETRSIMQALLVFLFKLRTGNSNKLIAAVLGMKSEQQVSEFCSEVMQSFEKDVLPKNFGFNSISREKLISETSYTAKKLLNVLDNQLVLIFDGTYIRHEKSRNNEYQRKSYSSQKKLPLCKPFTVCTTNGYIVDICGPFYATQNDASIMKIIMEDPCGLKTILRSNDIFIVDRGFRDVIHHITNEGYITLMPACKGKRAQLTTEEANMSRKVTKLRWVVEAVHGAIAQKFRLLHHILDNKMLPKVRLLCQIVGFLHNKYGKRLISDGELKDEIINYMNSRINIPNTLTDEVTNKRWSRRKSALKQLSSSELLDFPQLNERELKILFTGSYQLSQAVSYLAELIGDGNDPQISYVKEEPNIIKTEVRSRHINSKTYRVYLDYIPNGTNCQSIRRYCCDCPSGNRTVGCCSHIASVIYYLSNARYISRIVRPAEILSKIFDKENVPVVINENSDED